MGLDMRLTKRTYIKNWSHMKPEELHNVVVTKNGQPTAIKPERVSEIIEEVAYWRKANQIHQWFVDNVQKGEDDCKEYIVEKEDLSKLLDLVNTVLEDNSRAKELLPTQEGFFFGTIEYDEYYFEDLRDTQKVIKELLGEEDSGEYYYNSSW